jgi:hypothetical protein
MTGNCLRRASTSLIAVRKAGAVIISDRLWTRTASVAFCVKCACLRIVCARAVSPEPVSASTSLTVPAALPRK